MTYEEKPVKILDHKARSTRNKDVKIVKVLWSNQEYEEATWEAEHEMRKKYPELFNEVSYEGVTLFFKGGRMRIISRFCPILYYFVVIL